MPPLTQTNTSTVKDTSRGKLNQIVSTISDNSSTNTTALVTALNAIVAAITAKPSA